MPRTRKPRAKRAVPSGLLSTEERIALLDKRIACETREFAAIVRSRTDFEVVLARGTPVNHRLHLLGLAGAASLAALSGWMFAGAGSPAAVVLLLPAGYALVWLFLAMTGGEQLERLSIDDKGVISGARTGHEVGWQGDVLKVAVPAILIALAGWVTLGLIHDIVFSPQPWCQMPAERDNQFCRYIPGLGHGTALTVGQTKALERLVRSVQLLYSGALLLGAVWFLRRMLTGRWVADVRPVRRPRQSA